MTDTTAAFCDVTSFGGRVFPLGDGRRVVRAIGGSVAIGLGSVATVGLLIVFVTLAAAWIVNTVFSAGSHLHAGEAMRLQTIALAGDYPRLAGTTRFSASSLALSDPIYAPPATFEAKTARARAPIEAVAETPVLPPPRVSADKAPSPPAVYPSDALHRRAKHELAGHSDRTQVAKLAPAAPSAPASTLSAPPKAVPERAEDVPLPQPHPLNRTPDQAKPEVARLPAGRSVPETAPRVATVAPPPPASPVSKSMPPREAHNKSLSLPNPDSRTAVYDIAAHTVYLPSGEKLEAHSGLYDKMDDPRYVNVKMRGPTPPNVYDLTLREQLFHGVRAIRLNPVDENKMYGRDGMLAHTYMLGPNGQSNGCVSFRDYDRFLHAFLRGEVDRMVVVSRLGDTPVPVAARSRRSHGGRYAANDPPVPPSPLTW